MCDEFGMKLKRGTPAPKVNENINEDGSPEGSPSRVKATPHSADTELQDALDKLSAETLQQALKPQVLGPMMKPVSAAIHRALQHSETPEEFRASLSALLEEIPTIKSQMDVRHFAGTLSQGMTSALVNGVVAAKGRKG